MNSNDLIHTLHLQPHPEGGFYKETYRSNQSVTNSEDQNRNVCTAIYYLLENDDKSHFHRIKSDELWYFHQGQALEIVSIQNNNLVTILLGNELSKGEVPQAMIPANTWFGSKVKNDLGFSFVSCSVAPGFDFADFEMAKLQDLIQLFPHLKDVIEKFTKE